MPVLVPIEPYADELTAIRRDLDGHSEIGFEKVLTSGIVAEKLRNRRIETHRGIDKTGVVGILRLNISRLDLSRRCRSDRSDLRRGAAIWI
jgi:metal-dependent amidase/aminoacylase/carboxypeptidase family protein